MGGRGWAGWSGVKGEKWDNCNSIINKYIFKKRETHLKTEYLHRLKVKCWKQIFQANGQEKKAGVAILISVKIDFKKRAIERDPESHS